MGPLLLILLAALWAAVLIPATRGSRHAAYDGRSIQGFHTAMRVLSRRPAPTTYGRTILVPTPDVTRPEAGPARALARRRRILVRLAWTAGLTLLAAVTLGGPWPWLHAVADVFLVGYVVRLRQLALHRAEAARAARRAALVAHEEELRAVYDAKVAAAATRTPATDGLGDHVAAPAAGEGPAYAPPPRRAVND